jgi:hypothetical protein
MLGRVACVGCYGGDLCYGIKPDIHCAVDEFLRVCVDGARYASVFVEYLVRECARLGLQVWLIMIIISDSVKT